MDEPLGRELDTEIFTVVSIMLDGGSFSPERDDAQRTIAESLPGCDVWFVQRWFLGLIIPWEEEKQILHFSFGGGNGRSIFWNEWVYPNAEPFIGAIFFLDARYPRLIPLLREITYMLQQYNQPDLPGNMFSIPPVIALVNTDHPTAWDEQDIHDYLLNKVKKPVFVKCDPQDWSSVKALLITACQHFSQYL